jgi:hypothetical protein
LKRLSVPNAVKLALILWISQNSEQLRKMEKNYKP